MVWWAVDLGTPALATISAAVAPVVGDSAMTRSTWLPFAIAELAVVAGRTAVWSRVTIWMQDREAGAGRHEACAYFGGVGVVGLDAVSGARDHVRVPACRARELRAPPATGGRPLRANLAQALLEDHVR